ncbi:MULTISPECIES: hypothetical protein [unclassified Chryseobacterium]|uniref:hypothetical protein n=1 Tax=unclassified Chryseobacterium TaxID=2593645 RepID=UPI000D95B9A3|nr:MULTISPECIES: hypothetical protein [unclassified Chryseobacterium]PWW25662.1 hypothetical protein DEU40_11176 [Chryseobacterium sp. AG844]
MEKVQDKLGIAKLLIASCFFCLIQCQEKKQELTYKNVKNNTMQKIEISSILEGQLKKGAAEEYGSFSDYSEKDLIALIELEDSILHSNGYKNITNDQFAAKIEQIFGRRIDFTSSSNFLKIDTYNKCDKELSFVPLSAEYQNIYVSKNNKLISYFYPLPLLIDYQKNYPDLKKIEDIPIEVETNEGRLKVTQWKDIPNLKEQQKKNNQILVARNMYLFNDNKAYITWLVTQDPSFVKTLVKQFGFTKEPKFNDLVMSEYLNNYETSSAIGDIIFVKNCKGELEIRVELLNYIKEHTKSDENRLLNALENFGYALKDNNSFTTDEKYKILAYIGNTVDPFYLNFAGVNSGRAVWNAESVLYNSIVKDRNIISVFQKNNYYGLHDLKDSLIRVQGIMEHSSE